MQTKQYQTPSAISPIPSLGGTADPRQHDQHRDGRSRLQRLCSGAPRGTTAGVRSPAPHTYPPFPKARPACSFSESFPKSPVPSQQSLVQFLEGQGLRDRREAPAPSWLRLPPTSDPQITADELQMELEMGTIGEDNPSRGKASSPPAPRTSHPSPA